AVPPLPHPPGGRGRMTADPTTTRPAGPAGATAPCPPTDPPVEAAPVPGPGRPHPEEDVGALLHKRLRFLSLLLTGALVVALLLVFGSDLPADPWAYFAVGVLGLGPLAAGVLWGRRSLSLRQLRAVELVLFGTLYAHWSLVHAFLYPKVVLP